MDIALLQQVPPDRFTRPPSNNTLSGTTTAQRPLTPLDRRDANLGGGVDRVAFQKLDGVFLRELVTAGGADELLELVQRLFAEVGAVDEEQDSFGIGVLDQAVAKIDGGVGLAAAGRHLDQGARPVARQRRFEVLDAIDLRLLEVRGRKRVFRWDQHLQRWVIDEHQPIITDSGIDMHGDVVDPGSLRRVDRMEADANGVIWHITGRLWTSHGVPHVLLQRHVRSSSGSVY